MRIEIVNNDGDLITSFELEANPFKVGETININVSNYDKEFWEAKEVVADFKIEEIRHFLRKDYLQNQKYSCVFTVSVEVSLLSN